MALDNVRHESFAQLLAQNKPKQDAYKEVYPNVSPKGASVCASNLIKSNPAIIQRAIDIVKEREGTKLDALIAKAEEKMSATSKGRYGVQEEHTVQLEAVKLLLRLHGELREGNDINIDNRQIYLDIDKAYIEDTNKLLDRFKAMMSEADTIDGEIVKDTPKQI